MKTHENRKSARKSHNSVLEIFDADGTFITGVGRLVDFSTKGACFSSRKKMPADGKLRLSIRLLNKGALEVEARIVWVKPKTDHTLYGIAFERFL